MQKVKFSFNAGYLLTSILLFIIEVLIAIYMHDTIIRPYGGDFLVVILLYCMVRTVLDVSTVPTALGVLVFSYIVEITQYFRLADHLGLKKHSIARILIGDYFTWTDIASYTLGIITVIAIEKVRSRKQHLTPDVLPALSSDHRSS